MVATFEPSASQAGLPGARAPVAAFPLSSPHHETLTKFKPVNGGTALAANDTFLSPNPFASSSSDDDSGSSSGQDEFHLERYSQDNAPSSRPHRKQSRRRKQQAPPQSGVNKKVRPGLNVVTTFSTQAKRSNTDGLLIEQVQSQRPRLGPRYATSIKSAKAEHMDNALFERRPQAIADELPPVQAQSSKRAIARQAVSKLQASQASRKREAEVSRTTNTLPSHGPTHNTLDRDHLQTPASAASGYSPGAQSIVISMSVPEDEVDAHRSAGGGNKIHSRNTPDTPTIVITPADDTDSWKPPFFNRPRPSSSVYSPFAKTGLQMQQSNLPPVPKIPSRHARHGNPNQSSAGATIIYSAPKSRQPRQERSEYDDDSDQQSIEGVSRVSVDSQERILPSDLESRRHKSQGWWNLMLSPMLSRKGTVVEKGNDRSPETPPVPAIPADMRLSKSEVVTPLTSESPETPRRLGLASARASVWSRWTTWERERDRNVRSSPTDENDLGAEQPRDMVRESSPVPPLPAPDFSKGFAAEYYHACAIEQLSGIPYFECVNHSCAEKLPQLQSIFDKGAPVASSRGVETSTGVTENSGLDAPTIDRESKNAAKDDHLSRVGRVVMVRGISSLSEPGELSPNIRQANTATVLKARAIETPDLAQSSQHGDDNAPKAQTEQDLLAGSRSIPSLETFRREPRYPSIAAVALPSLQPPVLSPGPVSPGMQQTMTSDGAVCMDEIEHHPAQPRLLVQSPTLPGENGLGATQPPPVTIHNHNFYSDRYAPQSSAAIQEARKEAMERLESTNDNREVIQPPKPTASRAGPEGKDEEHAEKKEKSSLWSKLRRLLPKRTAGNTISPDKKKKRWWKILIFVILFLIVLACILLATLLTRSGDGTPVQSQWLNLTGYPPIPTGISTIARPDVVKQQSKCVGPNTMWSCALPKEDQFEVAPNSPDQPNFRFQITFRNGTVPSNMTIPVQNLQRRSARNLDARADDPFTNDLFTPNPAPPSRADQIFMGNTTDNITAPFEGEQTPFFVTFIPVFPIDPSDAAASGSNTTTSRLRKRQSTKSSDGLVPDPDVLDDGSAAPANLLPTDPFPTSQPVKLYNRGQADEHYGFYMYYDKAIFLHSTAPLNNSEFAVNGGNDPLDAEGGSTRDQSQLRCTFSQTRFLVRMWTNPAFGATLLPAIIDNSTNGTNAEDQSSATDFSRPGSFPYPTTISIDRHGGNINKKAVYCYGVSQLQVLLKDVKAIVPELRSVEGTLINAAPALVNGTVGDDSDFDQQAGGIDGGNGGCECVWQNWN